MGQHLSSPEPDILPHSLPGTGGTQSDGKPLSQMLCHLLLHSETSDCPVPLGHFTRVRQGENRETHTDLETEMERGKDRHRHRKTD